MDATGPAAEQATRDRAKAVLFGVVGVVAAAAAVIYVATVGSRRSPRLLLRGDRRIGAQLESRARPRADLRFRINR